jgi:hypothetical protein
MYIILIGAIVYFLSIALFLYCEVEENGTKDYMDVNTFGSNCHIDD